MQKRLLSGLFWMLLLNLLVKPLWIFGIEVGVQNTVGNATYGFYSAVFNLAYIFNILLDIGITNFNARNIAQHPQLIAKHLGGILCLKVLLLGLYVLVTVSVGMLMGYGSEEFRLLAWLCVAQFLVSLILYLRSNFEGLLLFKWDSVISVLDRVLMILICGSLLWSPLRARFNIYWFVYAQVGAYALTALVALTVLVRKSHMRRIRWNWPFFLVILKQSAPFAMLVQLMASYNRIDPILLRAMVDDRMAGIYAGAFRLLDAVTMVAYLVSVLLLPVYARLCKQDRSQIASITRLVFMPMMAFGLVVAVGCSACAEPIMRLLYHDNGIEYVPVFRVIIFGIIPIGLTYIFGTLLTAGGYIKQLVIFAAVSLLLYVGIDLILIPRYGAVGSAWTSLFVQSFMAVAQLLLAVRVFSLPASAFRPPAIKELKNLPSLIKPDTPADTASKE